MGVQLRGKVTDAEGEPLAYAGVYVEHTTTGVVTNIKGEYFLDLPAGNYTIVFQSLGYRAQSIPVELKIAKVLDVVLQETEVELETVELTAGRKDPAYKIMEQVIARKDEYVHQFEGFQCETYLKVSLEVDTLPKKNQPKKEDSPALEAIDSLVAQADTLPEADSLALEKEEKEMKEGTENRQKLNFIESWSTSYFAFPTQFKSIVHAYRDMTEKVNTGTTAIVFSDEGTEVQTYNTPSHNPYLFYTDISDADLNFYRNLVDAPDLSDRPLISPLSSTSWRLSYSYSLEDQFLEDGKVIYKIRVKPRLANGPYFDGHLYIVDKEWAIKSVSLRIVPSSLTFFNYFQVIHNYERMPDGRWVIVREDYYYNTKEGRVRYYGNSIALHSEYQLDPEMPKGFFRNELRWVEDDARDKDSTWWNEHRPIALKQVEVDFIRERDSINAYHASKDYLREQDSSYNKIKFWDPILNGIGIRKRDLGLEYYINPLIAQVRPFGVGGYRHAMGGYVDKQWKNFMRVNVSGELDYGFKNKDLRGHAKVGFTYLPKRFGKAYVKGGSVYSMINGYTTVATLLSRGNYLRKDFFGLGHEMEIVNGLIADFSFEFADRKSISSLELEQWSQELFGSNNAPEIFDPYREMLFELELRYTPFQKYYTEPKRKVIVGSKWPDFYAKYKKSVPGIFGSEINFDYLEIGAKHEFKPGTWGISRWSASAGKFLQAANLRFTDFKFFRGSDPFLFANPLNAFQLLGPTISTQNAWFRVNYLHDDSGLIIDKIPLLNRTPLQLTCGGGVLLIQDGSFLHTELYGGLQLPFRIKQQRFKVGAYYVTSYSNYTDALSSQIKFGLTFFNSFKNSWDY